MKLFRKRNKTRQMTFKSFILLSELITEDSMKALKDAPYYGHIGKHETITDLNGLYYGELVELNAMLAGGTENINTVVAVCERFGGVTKKQVMKAPAQDVISFLNMIGKEVERIGQLFKNCQSEPTAEERKAGVDLLNFGTFGLVDWYAKRMGIIDHDYVMTSVKWLYLYKCLQMDSEKNAFERRLNKIYTNKHKK